MFEDHQFPSLAVLYFDSHEVLTQVFDGDPDAMPRLRALSPAADVQPAYLEALHPAAPPTTTTTGRKLGREQRRARHGAGRSGQRDEGRSAVVPATTAAAATARSEVTTSSPTGATCGCST